MATNFISLFQAQVTAAITAYAAKDWTALREAVDKAIIYAAALPDEVEVDGTVLVMRDQIKKLKDALAFAQQNPAQGGGQALQGFEFA